MVARHMTCVTNPDSKVHAAIMGPTWGRQDPGRPHVDPMNLVIWEAIIWTNADFIRLLGMNQGEILIKSQKL